MANEKRVIDANELTDRLKHTAMVAYPNLFPGLLSAVEIVDDSPAVDAVEVVFCDECANHGQCIPEDTFRLLRIEKPFCCIGRRKTNTNCGAKMDGG